MTALANWTRTEIKPCLVAYTWRGWTLDELAARAAELEAQQ